MKKPGVLLIAMCGFGFVLNAQNDIEPNNTWKEAVGIQIGQRVEGTINLVDEETGENDTEDWYKLTIPSDGSLSIIAKVIPTSYFMRLKFYLMVVEEDEVNGTYTNYVSADNKEDFDTLTITDLPQGEYYFKLVTESGAGGYEFTTSFDAWLGGDAEPNDTQAQSVDIQFGQNVSGHIGMRNPITNQAFDQYDFYKIVLPSNGALHLYCKEQKLNARYFQLKTELYSEEEPNVNLGFYEFPEEETSDAETKTVTFHKYKDNLAAGTYYIGVKDYYGPGAYSFRAEFQPAPEVDFSFVQNNTNVVFTNLTKDGATKYEWEFGDGYSSTLANPSHDYVDFSGKPLVGVYNVTLTAQNENGKASATKEVSIRGLQRIESTRGGQGVVTINFYAGGLKEKQKQLTSKAFLRLGAKEIEAEEIVRVSTGCVRATFDLTDETLGQYDAIIRNDGEEDMVLEKAFVLETSQAPQIYTDLQTRQKVLRGRFQTITATIGNKGNTDAMYQTLWIVTPHGQADTVQVKFLNVDFNTPEDIVNQEVLDRMNDYEVYDHYGNGTDSVRVYGLLFQRIPANSSYEVMFKVLSFTDYDVNIYTTNSLEEHDTNKTSTLKASAAEASCVGEAMFKYLAGKGLDAAMNFVPFYGCAKDVITEGAEIAGTMAGGGRVSVGSWIKSLGKVTLSCAADISGGSIIKAVNDIVGTISDVNDNYQASKDCKAKSNKSGSTRAVASMDPNEMIGPSGFGEGNCIAPQTINYTILFENKTTATAPAQEVVITDQIDMSLFDINSVRFTGFGYAEKIFKPTQNGTAFAQDVELTHETTLRIVGNADTEKGVLSWRFLTLDNSTMDLTEDPDAGFLKPNITSPEGEGYVSFAIDLLPSAKNNDVLKNQATIVFDVNEPIVTNTYVNTIDTQAPQSNVAKVEATDEDGLYKVTFDGTDGGAGIRTFDLYTINEDNMHQLVAVATNSNELIVELAEGKHSFYSVATDNVGNMEIGKLVADLDFQATKSAIRQIDATNGMHLFPNPAKEYVDVEFLDASGDNVLCIYSADGRELLRQNVDGCEMRVPLSGFAQGIYVVRCGAFTERLIVR